MAERALKMEEGRLVALDVYQSTKIEFGKIVCQNAAGYAIEGALTAGLHCMGVARSTADNSSGSDADITVDVMTNRAFWFDNSSANAVDIADVGDSCYVEDDETVRDFVSGGVNVRAGCVLKVCSTDGVLVYFDCGIAPVDTAITGDVAITGALSVSTTLGVTGVSTLAAVVCTDIDPTGDISLDSGKALNIAVDGVLVAPYEPIASGGAPTQAEMVTGFGAAANGKVGVFADTGGVLYLCAADAALTWHYVAMTVGAP